jgi:DNA (cytosine-5)-methyltransferase 1
MAMLQSFPMDFKFWGSKREQRKQVGNAVPIKLVTAIAKSVHDSLTLIK